jgi:DNA-binding transcriptional MerR regulator
MELRVEQLAAEAGVSVDTVRYYQSRGLLPGPERRGRVAIYDDAHIATLRRIRSLQERGLPLRVIGGVLAGAVDDADLGLAEAVAAATSPGETTFTLDELAEASGVPMVLLRSVEQAGLLIGREIGGELRYSADDLEIVRSGLALLDAGLPLQELLDLASTYDAAARTVADRAVELFDRHIREPIIAGAEDEADAGVALVASFSTLLPAVTNLIAHHFRRVLLEVAERRFTDEAAPA